MLTVLGGPSGTARGKYKLSVLLQGSRMKLENPRLLEQVMLVHEGETAQSHGWVGSCVMFAVYTLKYCAMFRMAIHMGGGVVTVNETKD